MQVFTSARRGCFRLFLLLHTLDSQTRERLDESSIWNPLILSDFQIAFSREKSPSMGYFFYLLHVHSSKVHFFSFRTEIGLHKSYIREKLLKES